MAEEKHSEGHSEEGHGSHGGGGHGAHAGGGHEEHEGAPEWLISFADNVALMMGFFVILLAMNMKAPVAKGGIGSEQDSSGSSSVDQLDFIIALRQAFNPIDLDSTNPHEAAMRQRIRERLASPILRSKQPQDHGDAREHQSTRPTDLSNLGGTVPFDDDSYTLSTKARQRAEEIASRIRGQRYFVEIRGHTSPSETYRNAAKAFDLSFKRAMAVGESLAASGVPWEQIRVVECGANELNVPRNYTEEDRQNQRVEVIVTSDRLPDPTNAPAPEAPPAPDRDPTEPG